MRKDGLLRVAVVLLSILMLCGCANADDEVPTVTTTAPAATQETTVPATTVPETTAHVETMPAETEPVQDTTAPAVTTIPAETEPVQETTTPATEPAKETTTPVTEPAKETDPPVETTVPPTTQAPVITQTPANDEFVVVADYIPGVIIDLKYATADNMCGKVVYSFDDAYLRYGTVKKLAEVQKELAAMGYSLKIWDAYRPATEQFEIWDACHNLEHMANPQRGYNAHCRGSNVDVTIVDGNGKELEMPSGFDDFSAAGDRDFSDCSAEAVKNAQLLDSLMTKHGFEGFFLEWWQYTDSDDYAIELEFLCK